MKQDEFPTVMWATFLPSSEDYTQKESQSKYLKIFSARNQTQSAAHRRRPVYAAQAARRALAAASFISRARLAAASEAP